MYDQHGREVAPVAADKAPEPEAATQEAADAQSAEVVSPAVLALIDACRSGDLSAILEQAAQTPEAGAVLLKQGDEAQDLYPEAAFWPALLARLEQTDLRPDDRLNLATLCASLPENARREVLVRVFGLDLDALPGADRLDAEALAELAAEAARLPEPAVEEEVEEEEATEEAPTGEAARPPVARSLSTQATLARIGLNAREAPEVAREIEETLGHELGQDLYFREEGAASDKLRQDAGWKVVSPQEFVEACEPQVEDNQEAVALLEERFGEGRDPEVIEDKGDPDAETEWWKQVEALQERFPNLVGALQLTRYGKHLQRKAVRGGFAHANFLSRTLSILSPDLYQRLGRWSNEVAVISDKTWAAEIYRVWLGGGVDPKRPPDWLGPAELAYLETLKRQYPHAD